MTIKLGGRDYLVYATKTVLGISSGWKYTNTEAASIFEDIIDEVETRHSAGLTYNPTTIPATSPTINLDIDLRGMSAWDAMVKVRNALADGTNHEIRHFFVNVNKQVFFVENGTSSRATFTRANGSLLKSGYGKDTSNDYDKIIAIYSGGAGLTTYTAGAGSKEYPLDMANETSLTKVKQRAKKILEDFGDNEEIIDIVVGLQDDGLVPTFHAFTVADLDISLGSAIHPVAGFVHRIDEGVYETEIFLDNSPLSVEKLRS
jgi:hypothetical protein